MFGLMILFVFSDDSDDDKTHTVDLLVDTLKETAALLLLTDRHTSLTARGQWAIVEGRNWLWCCL